MLCQNCSKADAQTAISRPDDSWLQVCWSCHDEIDLQENGPSDASPSPVKVADDLFDAAFGRRPGGTPR